MKGIISIYKDIKHVEAGYERPIFYVLDRIKSGTSRLKVEEIRNCPDSAQIQKLKQELPSICFAGTFFKRNDSGIKEHSGFICLDYDKFPNDKEMSKWKDILCKSEYTFSLFISPSGKGFKQIVQIPNEVDNHRSYFKAIKEHFDSPYWDDSSINISRVCYESYDPEIYVNKNSKIWDKLYLDEQMEWGTNNPVLPLENTSQIIQKLQVWFDKKFVMGNGQRNNNTFVFASAMSEFGIPQVEAQSYLYRYAEKDFSQHEIDTVIKSAYMKGKSTFGSKYFEDVQTKKIIESRVKSGKSKNEILSEFQNSISATNIENVIDNTNENTPITEFWSFDKNGNCKISNYKFKEFLQQNGFYKLYPNGSENFVFIKVENNLVENSSDDFIKDFVLNYLIKHKYMIPYEILTSNLKYFNENYLSFLDSIDIKFFEDTQNSGVIYFKNGALIVTKDKIELVDYLDLDGFIWKKHVINRNFYEVDYSGCVYDVFISRISGDKPDKIQSIKSTIGYLLHSFKTSADNKAVILNDETISENPNGGSGKGIFFNAISKIKRVEVLDGKTFSNDKSFPYQTVGADTQILVFDDVKKTFGFEYIFSLITEGITLEKKNKDAIKLPVNKSPKIIITTNYTIGGIGGSHERRKWEVEFSSYFNSNNTPLDEFNHLLFDEWDETEWTKFDNFMVDCLKIYLNHKLIKFEFHNLETRKFIKETCFEFYEYITDETPPVNERIFKGVRFEDFKKEYPDTIKWITQKRFSQWFDIYAKFKGYSCLYGKDGGRWIQFVDSKRIDTKQNDLEFPTNSLEEPF